MTTSGHKSVSFVITTPREGVVCPWFLRAKREAVSYIPTLGSRVALLRLSTISLMDDTVPFLLWVYSLLASRQCHGARTHRLLSFFPFLKSFIPCPTFDGGVIKGCGVVVEGKKNLHLEVAADEELASHDCDV